MRLLLNHIEDGFTKRAHELLRIDRPNAANHTGAEIFLDPLDVVGAVALRNEARNWTPWVRSLIQDPLA